MDIWTDGNSPVFYKTCLSGHCPKENEKTAVWQVVYHAAGASKNRIIAYFVQLCSI